MNPSRRAVLRLAPLFALSLDRLLAQSIDPSVELGPFDQLMAGFVAENKVPGASLAVTRHGQLVYACGFGMADVDRKELVQPSSLFRIASVSKPITAVAILQLVEQKKLGLDDRVLDRMPLKPHLQPGKTVDERWKRITVRHCLQHRGGWDRGKSYDPIVRMRQISSALGTPYPVTPDQIVRFMMGEPLDFDPGERFAYSNLGYLVLGRILEHVTGEKYEDYIKKAVFAPLGITAPRLGRALLENQAPGEVRYYDAKKAMVPCVYPPRVGKPVPLLYGGMNLEAYEAHGGWIASTIDLVRFASAFDRPEQCPILKANSIEEMYARPDSKSSPTYYALGWDVRPQRQGRNTWHTGYIPGSEAILVRRHDGLNWAVLFNTNNSPDGKSLSGLIDGKVHEAADAVKAWPNRDLFPKPK